MKLKKTVYVFCVIKLCSIKNKKFVEYKLIIDFSLFDCDGNLLY